MARTHKVFLSASLAALLVAGAGRAQTTQKTSGSLSLAKVEELVGAYKEDALGEKEVIRRLSPGLNFTATQAVIDELRAKGASDLILAEIVRFAQPAPPPAPKPDLSVSCRPAECNIKLNDRKIGRTKNGALTIPGLDPGETVINFEKDGYITEQRTVTMRAEPVSVGPVPLKPTLPTQAEFGAALHIQILKAHSTKAGLNGLASISGAGSITTYNGGKQTAWDVQFAMGPPDLVEIELSGIQGVLTYRCKGEACTERKKGGVPIVGRKKVSPEVLRDLDPNLRTFLRYNLRAFLESLSSTSVRFTAPSPDPAEKEEQQLHADAADCAWDITVDADSLLKRAECNSKGSLRAGLTISYGNYAKVGEYRYPKVTNIRSPDKAQSGIEVRLERISLGSDLNPKGFPK